jgi:hypothetical protein
MLKLEPPTWIEKTLLMEFICKRSLSLEEKDSLNMKGTEEFSIAHLEEIAVRAELDDKTYPQVVKELIDHKKLFKADFDDKNSKGFGIINDFDN